MTFEFVCSECREMKGLLMRCGVAGPPKQVGCRRLICEDCLGGFYGEPSDEPLGGAIKRPLCKTCAQEMGGST